MSECAELERTHALADGELSGDAAQQARDHLATCAECQDSFADALQLAALPMPRATNAGAAIISLAWYRRRRIQVAGIALAAAAGLAIYVATTRPHGPNATAPLIALADKRPIEARVTWGTASAFRPYDVPRAGEPPHETIALAALADVERTGDLHGVGVLALLDGDRKQAASYLERAAVTADVLADRAALALGDGDPARALGLADAALDRAPGHAVALWNRALALRDLGLSRGAATAFREVAKRGEPGWAEEATRRADALDAAFTAQLELSLRVRDEAKQLAADGSGLSVDDVRALPGMARIAFYDAVRAAPTPDAIAKLRPLAEALDAADHTTGAVAALAHVPDPALARGYADIIAGKPPERAKYLSRLRAAHANDLLIGALLKLGPDGYHVALADIAEYAKLTAASPDPWMQLLGLEQQADVTADRGDLPGTEAILLRARPLCAAGAPNFRCMKIAMALGEVYIEWQRLPEARTALAEAWQRARAAAQWEFESAVLPNLAWLATLADDAVGGGLPLARAYTDEATQRAALEQQHHLRTDACDVAKWAHETVGTILVNQLRFADAAKELASAPTCDGAPTDLTAAIQSLFVRAEVVRISGTPAEAVALQKQIAVVRGAPELTIGDKVFLDQSEGRLLIDRDPTAGEALLRRAIAAAKTAPATDPNAHRGAAISYSLLAVAAATRGDGAGALATLADELGVPAAEHCALGLAAEDLTTIAVARGVTGAAVASHRVRTSTTIDPAALVPPEIVTALAGCPVVDVLARAPIHGTPRLLPDDVAWRYLSVRARPANPPGDRRLVVADVEPPAALGLPRLGAWSATPDQLSGPSATPARVLAAIGAVGEVVIHAHGLVDQADASYLALSPDAAGHYALTAGDVRAAKFTTSPLVILAACRAAQAAPLLQQPWSLPAAFVYAGARAVIASASPIPDGDAGAFFDALRAHAGSDVAVALRDVRQQWLAQHHADWVRDLIVFE